MVAFPRMKLGETVEVRGRAGWRSWLARNHSQKQEIWLVVAYKRIRLAFIEGARGRPEMFATRLRYFVRITAAGKRYGVVQD